MVYYYALVIPAAILGVYCILRLYGVFEVHSGSKKAIEKQDNKKSEDRKRSFEIFKLNFYETMTGFTSWMFDVRKREEHDYFIKRLQKRSEVLNRNYTPEEYRGKHVTWLAFSLVGLPLMFVNKIFIAIPILGVLQFVTYETFCRNDIQDEDDIIDANFTDLYLLMYSELRKGSKGSIKGVVLAYQQSLQSMGLTKMTEVMLKFTEFLLNSLNYTTESEAIQELKTRYHSALITNFCNVAVQSLQGIDNYDTLLSTKMNLTEKRKQNMLRITEKRRKQGEILIYGVYIILAQFIILSILSKLPSASSLF